MLALVMFGKSVMNIYLRQKTTRKGMQTLQSITLNVLILTRSVVGMLLAQAAGLAFSFTCANAAPGKDFYIQQALDRYFTLPQDSQALATGGASALSCSSSACIYMNPAGLGSLTRFEFSGSLGNRSFDGDEFLNDESIEQSVLEGYGVLSVPVFSGSIALGVSRYQGDTDDVINSTPDGHRRSLGYGVAINKVLSLGYSLNFYDDQLQTQLADLHSHARFLHIFGAQAKLTDDLMISGTFNLGIGQADTEEFSVASNGLSHLREYSGAAAIKKIWSTFSLFGAVDFSHVRSEGDLVATTPLVVIGGNEGGNNYSARLGAEQEVTENLVTRLGFRWFEVVNYNFERPDITALSGTLSGMTYSAGFGYLFRADEKEGTSLRADYGISWSAVGQGGWEHMLTLAVPFSL